MIEFLRSVLWMIEAFLRMIEPLLWVVLAVGFLVIGLGLLGTAGSLLWDTMRDRWWR